MEARRDGGQIQDLSERDAPSACICDGWDAFKLAYAIIADSAMGSELGKDLATRASGHGVTAQEFDDLGPRA